MTPKVEGPRQRTPAQPCGSTDQQGAAALLRDECEEQLQRLADQAENYEITPPGSRKWITSCEQIGEWVGKAAHIEKTYGERLRDLLRDKTAMEKRAREDRPAIEFQIRRLFRAFRKIYDSAWDNPTPPRVQRIAGRIIYGAEALYRDIQNRMARHRSEILRARDAPFKEFYAWRAEERNRHAHASVESESKLPGTQSRRGPTADMDLHQATEQVVTPYGSNWKNESNLEKIAEQLDKNPLTPPPKQWAERKPPARSWSRAVRHYPEVVVKRISYSLKMARRNPH